MSDKIREALQDMLEWLEHVDHRDGYCCCGMRMSTHEKPEDCGHVPLDAGEYHAGLMMAEARAALAQQSAPVVPEGWRLVPVEPTREMLVAINWPNDPAGYRAMLAAAPATPAGWKLVPVEPTPEMLAATSWPGCAGADYAKMISAAPAAPVAAEQPTDAMLDDMRKRGLSIDGDNAYKRDLIDCIFGALMLGKQGVNPPPAGHWLEQFWQAARGEGEIQEQLAAAPAAPVAQEPVALPDGITISKDFFGTVHIKLGDFDFIQIKYDHRYTYNSHQEWVANRIVEAITAPPTTEQPDTVAVPRELLERLAGSPDLDPDCCMAYYRQQLRTLLARGAA